MHLNIKSAETRQLAVTLARKTGDSITGAVTRALRSELRRVESGKSRRERLDEIVAITAPILADGPGSADIDALFYDENGLPK